MVTFDDFIANFQDGASDSTAASLVMAKRWGNQGYKICLGALGTPNIERTMHTTTRTPTSPIAAADRIYMLPPDALYPKSVVITNGSDIVPLVEEESQEFWDYETRTVVGGVPALYFVRPRFGVGGCEILLNSIPAAGETLTVIYEATDKDLSNVAYATGTITLAYNSATVTGSGVVFTQGMIGRYFKCTDAISDGFWYKIVDVPTSTTLTLENVYNGPINLSAKAFTINEVFNLPEDMQMLPNYYTFQNYYAMKKDGAQELKYKGFFETQLKDGAKKWSTKTRSNIIRPKRGLGFFGNYPANFPSSGISS